MKSPPAAAGERSLSSGSNKTAVTVISKIADRPSGKDACLVMIYGGDLGRKFNLHRGSLVIGRSSRADIQVEQDSISRSHARVFNNGKNVIVKDLGSTNGTYVNDELVEEQVLRDGDLVKIGRTIFKFLSGDNIEHAYHEEIYRLTTVDGLTQVFNKRYFMESLEREVSRALRYDRPLSVLMFDLDHFKSINDNHGHLAGDAVLKGVASLVHRNIRREDILARYGGEEFALILPETTVEESLGLAEKLRGLVEEQVFEFDEVRVPVTVSGGVAALSKDCGEPHQLLKLADEKLYEAKRSGRNRTCS